jgi:hypothetical protein
LARILIPPPYEPFVEPKSGNISEVWYRYLYRSSLGDSPIRYVHRAFSYSDTNTDLGDIPANAVPLETYVFVNSSFAGTDLIVGTSVNTSSVVSTNDLVSKSTGLTVIDRYMGIRSTVGTALYVQCNTTAGSAGQADVWQTYLEG